MEKKEKDKVICVLIGILIILIIMLIINILMGPKYDQELLDELNKNYESMKNIELSNLDDNSNNYDNIIENEVNVTKKKNPTHMTVKTSTHTYKVIGKIRIDKLSIEYPIIYETTDEYLKLAPTKVCGPVINTVGNLCIAGHNYLNGRLFSKLNNMKKGDIVVLIDNNDNALEYVVYDKFKAKQEDTSCLSQDTNFETEVTLITCTSNVEDRLIVKCRAK